MSGLHGKGFRTRKYHPLSSGSIIENGDVHSTMNERPEQQQNVKITQKTDLFRSFKE